MSEWWQVLITAATGGVIGALLIYLLEHNK